MNEKIEKAREVALNVLRPTQKELEHGLELHKNSLVCESYGFSPRSALDTERLKEAVEAGASPIEIQDLIEDMRMTRCVEDETERQEFIDAWEASGVTCIFQNAGQEGNSIERLIKRLARYTYVTDFFGEFLRRAVKPDDILNARARGGHCLYMSCNGVPLPQEWVSVEEEIHYIRVFFQLGVRMMHLTYNRRNVIGEGCGEKSDGGLSDFGRAVVREMNRAGVIVDVSHSSWKTSLDACEVPRDPWLRAIVPVRG